MKNISILTKIVKNSPDLCLGIGKRTILLPIITAGVTYAILGIEKLWVPGLLLLIIVEVLVYKAMYRALRVKEYLSGYVTEVFHHNAWVERVERHVSYTDSQGNVRTRVEIDYIRHPDKWFVVLNTGYSVDISKAQYCDIVRFWDSEEEWIRVFHLNCASGGNGYKVPIMVYVASLC